MNKKIIGTFLCMLMTIPVLSTTATMNQSPKSLDTSMWPSEGIIRNSYDFNIKITNVLDEECYYVLLDWGDRSDTGWLDSHSSGKNGYPSHTWNIPGEYKIKSKIKNKYGEIVCSNTFIIHIFETGLNIKAIDDGLFGVVSLIENIGTEDAMNVEWSIKFEDGTVILPSGGKRTGSIDSLSVGEEKTIMSGIVFGLRFLKPISVIITVSASNAAPVEDSVTVVIFLFYINVQNNN